MDDILTNQGVSDEFGLKVKALIKSREQLKSQNTTLEKKIGELEKLIEAKEAANKQTSITPEAPVAREPLRDKHEPQQELMRQPVIPPQSTQKAPNNPALRNVPDYQSAASYTPTYSQQEPANRLRQRLLTSRQQMSQAADQQPEVKSTLAQQISHKLKNAHGASYDFQPQATAFRPLSATSAAADYANSRHSLEEQATKEAEANIGKLYLDAQQEAQRILDEARRKADDIYAEAEMALQSAYSELESVHHEFIENAVAVDAILTRASEKLLQLVSG